MVVRQSGSVCVILLAATGAVQTATEMAGLPQLVDGAVDALEMFITEGLPKTMNYYNNKNLLL